ncbi:MAG: hypothetical protein ACOX8N_08710 [Christensenellales bacterium]|jgi:hypothetical protein
MEDIQARKNEKKHIFLFLVILNVLVLLFMMFGQSPAYETDDDFTLAGIVSGAQGEASPYMIFCNIVLGWLLFALYSIFPSVAWYPIVLIVFTFLAFLALGYAFMRKAGPLLGGSVYTLFLLTFSKSFYLVISFTRVAALAAAAGYVLLFYYVNKREEESRWLCALSAVLLVFASLLRWSCFLMVSLFAFVVGVYEVFIQGGKRPLRNIFTERRAYIVTFAVLLAGVFALQGLHQAVYHISPGWRDYTEYNNIRSELFDYGLPDYQKNREALQELGITENDFTMMSSWTFADAEHLDLDTMRAIHDMKSGRTLTLGAIKSFIKALPKRFLDPLFTWACVPVLLYLLTAKRRNWFLAIAFVLIAGVELFYLHFMGRNVLRVLIGIYICLACFPLYCMDRTNLSWKDTPMTAKRMTPILCGFVGVALLLNNTVYFQLADKSGGVSEEPRKSMLEMNQTDNLYLCDAYNTPYLPLSYRVFDVVDDNIFKNFYYLGGWTTYSPLTDQRLAKHGVTSTFRALAEREDVFLVDKGNIRSKAAYIREHYAKEISWGIYDEFCSAHIIAYSRNFDDVREGDEAELVSVVCQPIEGRDEQYFWFAGEVVNVPEWAETMYLELTEADGKRHTYRVKPVPVAENPDTVQFTVGVFKEDELQAGNVQARVVLRGRETAYAQGKTAVTVQ